MKKQQIIENLENSQALLKLKEEVSLEDWNKTRQEILNLIDGWYNNVIDPLNNILEKDDI